MKKMFSKILVTGLSLSFVFNSDKNGWENIGKNGGRYAIIRQ